jgi:hypothetical protein
MPVILFRSVTQLTQDTEKRDTTGNTAVSQLGSHRVRNVSEDGAV